MTQNGNELRSSRLPQWFAAIAADFGGLIMGIMLGWTAFTQYTLEHGLYHNFVVSEMAFSWVSGILSLGALLGSVTTGALCDKLGRKYMIILASVPCVFGAILLIFAKNTGMVLAARFIFGLSVGSLSCSSPLYVNEIAEVAIRGMLGSLFQNMVVVGILLTYIVGMNVDILYYSIFLGVVPIVMALLMLLVPESPYYYVMKNNNAAAQKSLRWLRGRNYLIHVELVEMQTSVEETKKMERSLSESWSDRPTRNGVLLSFMLMALQQLCGVNAVIFFTDQIFEETGSKIPSKYCSLIVQCFSLCGTLISTQITDRWGRKILLLLSSLISSIALAFLGAYFSIEIHDPTLAQDPAINVIPLVSMCVFIVVYSFGLGPLPWAMVPEISAPSVRSTVCSCASAFCWLLTFIISTAYEPAKDALGADVTFYAFAVIALVGFVATLAFVPETKGKTIEEIQHALGKPSSACTSVTVDVDMKSM